MASKRFNTEKRPSNRMKGGLDPIEANGIYAVNGTPSAKPSKKPKAKKPKIDSVGGKMTKDVVTHTVNGRARKVLCQVTHPSQFKTTVKNGEIGKNGKEKQTKVILGDASTYTFEMLIERYGSPRHWPTDVRHYDRKKGQWIDVDLREKWNHRIGKNRSV